MDLSNKVVWITGASSGIGKACAIEYSNLGAKIILSARSIDKLESLQRQLKSPSVVLPLDVADADSIIPKTKESWETFGHVDILVNNAGISQRSLALDTDIAVDRRLFEVNYFGNIALSKAIASYMVEQGSGNLVIISSVAGRLSTTGRSSYAATKHALFGYYDSMRAELIDTGVQVNMICPGYIKTDISINALDSSGSSHGVMDINQEKGMPAAVCANKIVRAVEKGKIETYIGGNETKFVYIKRFIPALYHKMIASEKYRFKPHK